MFCRDVRIGRILKSVAGIYSSGPWWISEPSEGGGTSTNRFAGIRVLFRADCPDTLWMLLLGGSHFFLLGKIKCEVVLPGVAEVSFLELVEALDSILSEREAGSATEPSVHLKLSRGSLLLSGCNKRVTNYHSGYQAPLVRRIDCVKKMFDTAPVVWVDVAARDFSSLCTVLSKVVDTKAVPKVLGYTHFRFLPGSGRIEVTACGGDLSRLIKVWCPVGDNGSEGGESGGVAAAKARTSNIALTALVSPQAIRSLRSLFAEGSFQMGFIGALSRYDTVGTGELVGAVGPERAVFFRGKIGLGDVGRAIVLEGDRKDGEENDKGRKRKTAGRGGPVGLTGSAGDGSGECEVFIRYAWSYDLVYPRGVLDIASWGQSIVAPFIASVAGQEKEAGNGNGNENGVGAVGVACLARSKIQEISSMLRSVVSLENTDVVVVSQLPGMLSFSVGGGGTVVEVPLNAGACDTNVRKGLFHKPYLKAGLEILAKQTTRPDKSMVCLATDGSLLMFNASMFYMLKPLILEAPRKNGVHQVGLGSSGEPMICTQSRFDPGLRWMLPKESGVVHDRVGQFIGRYLYFGNKKYQEELDFLLSQVLRVIGSGKLRALAVDLETTSLDPMLGEIVLISLSWDGTHSIVIAPAVMGMDVVLKVLECPLIGHNLKFDAKWIRYHYGIPVTMYFDTLVGSRMRYTGMLDGGHSLVNLADKVLGIWIGKDVREEFVQKGTGRTRGDGGGSGSSGGRGDFLVGEGYLEDRHVKYSALDAMATMRLANVLEDELRKLSIWGLWESIERPTLQYLVDTELKGIPIDPTFLAERRVKLGNSLADIDERVLPDICARLGLEGTVNLRSPAQVLNALHHLGLSVTSTDEGGLREILNQLRLEQLEPRRRKGNALGSKLKCPAQVAIEFLETLLLYRAYSKELTTYIDGWTKKAMMGHPGGAREESRYDNRNDDNRGVIEGKGEEGKGTGTGEEEGEEISPFGSPYPAGYQPSVREDAEGDRGVEFPSYLPIELLKCVGDHGRRKEGAAGRSSSELSTSSCRPLFLPRTDPPPYSTGLYEAGPGMDQGLEAVGRLYLYPDFDAYGAVTGRLSSRNPNMQNVPLELRGAVTAEPGCKIITVDMDQIEIRAMAAYAKEPTLTRIFNERRTAYNVLLPIALKDRISVKKKASEILLSPDRYSHEIVQAAAVYQRLDIHRIVASDIYGVTSEEVTESQRSVGKCVTLDTLIVSSNGPFRLGQLFSRRVERRGFASPRRGVTTTIVSDSNSDSHGLVTRVYFDGIRSGLRLTTFSGRSIVCSSKHMFRAVCDQQAYAWVRADRLREGNWVFTRRGWFEKYEGLRCIAKPEAFMSGVYAIAGKIPRRKLCRLLSSHDLSPPYDLTDLEIDPDGLADPQCGISTWDAESLRSFFEGLIYVGLGLFPSCSSSHSLVFSVPSYELARCIQLVLDSLWINSTISPVGSRHLVRLGRVSTDLLKRFVQTGCVPTEELVPLWYKLMTALRASGLMISVNDQRLREIGSDDITKPGVLLSVFPELSGIIGTADSGPSLVSDLIDLYDQGVVPERVRTIKKVGRVGLGDVQCQPGHTVIYNGFVSHNTIEYAILYGAGPRTLRETLLKDGLEVTEGKCAELMARFEERYPRIKLLRSVVYREIDRQRRAGFYSPAPPAYGSSDGSRLRAAWGVDIRVVNEPLAEKGVSTVAVSTLCGRTRFFWLPVDSSADSMRKVMDAQREAFNFLMQGSCATAAKLAIARLGMEFTKYGPSGPRILYSVHDELVIQCPDHLVDEVLELTQRVLTESAEDALDNRIPVEVSFTVGDRWGK